MDPQTETNEATNIGALIIAAMTAMIEPGVGKS
jgi:hypothetical protein